MTSLVKLGGSVLTDKAAYATPRPADIQRLAREVASARGPLAVVHGAGSFGHVLAKEHRLAEGDSDDPKRRAAYARVLADVHRLQGMVVDALQAAGLDAVPVATHDVGRTLHGAMLHFPSHAMRRYFDLGQTPVIPGSVVPDAATRFSILSGDAIMLSLARELRPERVVFATNVDGLFDRDPAAPGAKLVPRAHPDAAGHADDARGVADVTGGMGRKLERARDIARMGIPVHLVNGLVEGRVAAAVTGRDTMGTVIAR